MAKDNLGRREAVRRRNDVGKQQIGEKKKDEMEPRLDFKKYSDDVEKYEGDKMPITTNKENGDQTVNADYVEKQEESSQWSEEVEKPIETLQDYILEVIKRTDNGEIKVQHKDKLLGTLKQQIESMIEKLCTKEKGDNLTRTKKLPECRKSEKQEKFSGITDGSTAETVSNEKHLATLYFFCKLLRALCLIYKPIVFVLIFPNLFGLANSGQSSQNWTSCSANMSVFDGEPSAITCHFPYDVRSNKRDFNVIRYTFNGNESETILSCLWIPSRRHHPRCVVRPGYLLDRSTIGNKVTLTIPETKRENAGRYVCSDPVPSTIQKGQCTLAVKGWNTSCEHFPPLVPAGDSASVKCHYNADLSKTREDFYINKFDNHGNPPVRVLFCSWERVGKDHQPSCKVERGYTFDCNITSNIVTLGIPLAEVTHSGRYLCEMLPYHVEVHVDSCELKVTSKGQPTFELLPKTTVRTLPPQLSQKHPCQRKSFVVKGQATSMTCLIPKEINLRKADICVTREDMDRTSKNRVISDRRLPDQESSGARRHGPFRMYLIDQPPSRDFLWSAAALRPCSFLVFLHLVKFLLNVLT